MDELEKIKCLTDNGDIDAAIELSDTCLKSIPEGRTADEIYFLRGNAFVRANIWGKALENYGAAMSLNADSPAGDAYRMVMEIMDFYDKDQFNP